MPRNAERARLRDELHKTHHIGRIHRMLELGRAAKSGGAAGARALRLIDAFAVGDVFERRLSLYAMGVLGDGARVLPLTEDESASVRNLAFLAVPRVCDDAQALLALKVAYKLRRDRELIRALARKRRRPVIDRYLDWLTKEPGIHDYADLVPFATDAGVRRHLARALERPSAVFWSRLARSAPAALAQVLLERLAEGPDDPDAHTSQLINAHHGAIAERAPEAWMALLEELVRRGDRSKLSALRIVSRSRPRETLALIERLELTQLPRGVFGRNAASLSAAELGRLVARDPELLELDEALLASLRPDQLAALLEAWATQLAKRPRLAILLFDKITDPALLDAAHRRWSVSARDRDGVIAVSTVARLPEALREREARRHLREVIALGTRPQLRLPYARFLPWDEARAALRDHLGFPEGGVRGLALANLLMIPGLRPAETALVDKALELVTAKKHEQDPVRMELLRALVNWPRECWRAEHVPVIGQIMRDALDAGDLSHGTARLAETLVLRTFRLDPVAGAERLATLIRERGNLHSTRLGDHIGDEDIEVVAPHLVELARLWAKQERIWQLVQLAASLGARLARIPELSALVGELALTVPWGGTSRALLELLAQHDPPRYDALLTDALARWQARRWHAEILGHAGRVARPGHRRQPPLPSPLIAAVERLARGAGTNSEIGQALRVLHKRARPHLDAILGSLLADDPSYVCLPVIYMHLHRRRQDLLDPVLGGQRVTGRFATGQTAWLLPFTRGFYRWTPTQNQLYARALTGLIRDDRRDTPTIWRCLAIYAALDSAPMDSLAAIADDPRAAIQERAIRVMSRCDRGQCVPTLIRCLHDARARVAIYALRRALKDILPKRSVALLQEVPLRKVTVAKEVVRLLGELRDEGAYARLLELESGRLHRDVRIALLRALWDHLDREPSWAIFDRAVRGDDWVMASRLGDIPADRLTATSDRRLSALLGLVLDRPEPEARIDLLRRAPWLAIRDPARSFLRACAGRLRSPYDDEVTAATCALMQRGTRDDLRSLPELLSNALADPRCLHVSLNALLGFDIPSRDVWVGAAEAAASVLTGDRRWVPLQIRCVAAARPGAGLVAFLERLARGGALTGDALAAAQAALARLNEDALEEVIERLSASEDATIRWLAVAALARDAGPGRGWSPERLERLARLQRDAAPEVAGSALAIFPPREMAEEAAKRRTAKP